MKGFVFNISRYAIHDGPGIRVTVFMQGCPLQCWWCHNPESQSAGGGREMTVGEVMDVVDRDRLFMDESGGGVTFSGGEPLLQGEFLAAMLEACKKRELHTAVDTSGYGDSAVLRAIANRVDLFLFDLKIMDEGEHMKCVGASNRGILVNLKLLADMGARVVIRFPVIPGLTDSQVNLAGLADYVSSLKLREIHLLPYHQYAAAKYERMKLENQMVGVQPPSAERIEQIKRYFDERGFVVRVGG